MPHKLVLHSSQPRKMKLLTLSVGPISPKICQRIVLTDEKQTDEYFKGK